MRKLLASFSLVVLALFSIPNASAHVEIVSAFPEQYANVNPIPTQVWIQFSGDLQTLDGEAVNSLEVIDSTGIAVNYEDPVIDGNHRRWDHEHYAIPEIAEGVLPLTDRDFLYFGVGHGGPQDEPVHGPRLQASSCFARDTANVVEIQEWYCLPDGPAIHLDGSICYAGSS